MSKFRDYTVPKLVSVVEYENETPQENRYNKRKIGKSYVCYDTKYYVVKGGNSKSTVVVLLEDCETKLEVELIKLEKGTFKSPLAKTECGVGYIGLGDAIVSWKGNRQHPAYTIWHNMINRIYGRVVADTYKDVFVVDEWHCYNTFYKWFMENKPKDYRLMDGIHYELDKDLKAIDEDEKYYGPDRCIFIPTSLNIFLANKRRNTTTGFTGVKKNGNKYKAEVYKDGEYKYLGQFDTPEEAYESYQKQRAIHAQEWKDEMLKLGYDEDIVSRIS